MLVAHEEFVRLRKEELKEKSKKCDKLESENESLKRSLGIKETEQTRFKEHKRPVTEDL
jgi:cell shape-determining protein MreC